MDESEECTGLTNNQMWFAIKKVEQWIRRFAENGRGHGLQIQADVVHSALLRRLLSGKEPHENPPPLRHAYPAWEMVEDDETEIWDLHEVNFSEDEANVCVDQHVGYVWVDKEKKIIKYVRLGLLYQYIEREVTPDIKRLRKGLKPEDHKYLGKFLRRIREDENATPTA